MDTQQNIEFVKRFYDAYLKGDKNLLLSYMADDIDWDIPEMHGLAFSGKRRGRGEVAEFFGMVAQAQQLRSFEAQEFFGDGDRVVVLGHHAWTVKSNGAPFDSDWVHVFTVRDGRIAAFRQSMDTLKVVQAHRRTTDVPSPRPAGTCPAPDRSSSAAGCRCRGASRKAPASD